MGDGDSQKLMEDCRLSDMLQEQGDKMLYLFDFFSERSFFISVSSIFESPEKQFSIDLVGEVPSQINIDTEGIDDLMSEFANNAPKNSAGEYDEEEDIYGNDSVSFENIDDLEDY